MSLLAAACSPRGRAESSDDDNEALSGGHCGSERWSIKTGTDPQASQISLVPQRTTVAALGAIPAPHTTPTNQRVAPTETTEFLITNVTVRIKTEADSDYHLVITDATGATMVAEIPDPSCVGSSSPWLQQIAAARQVASGQAAQGASFTATLAGIGFFDNPHGQTGVAPNAIELHPVLGICVGQDCALAQPTDAGTPDAADSAPH